MAALIDEIHRKIEANWSISNYHKGSEENWRFEKQTNISDENLSPEVKIERAIVNIPEQVWADAPYWANQVPTASGLVHPNADRSRKIDLVHKRGDRAYEFIELKVGSDTPLYAAMEILKYGVLYVFAREREEIFSSAKKGHELLRAEKILLKVLAPATYYAEYDLSWLENCIKTGLDKFLTQRKIKLEMDFEFSSLPLIPSSSPVTWKKV